MNPDTRFPPVLVVDDDKDLRSTMNRVLRRFGCLVTTAASGQEALDALSAGFRGLVFMDVMMPGMDGWTTVRAIVDRGLASGNLICMLTAVVEPDERFEDLGSHIFDYLVKPFNLGQLQAILHTAAVHLSPES